MSIQEERKNRLIQYAESHGLILGGELGSGAHGSVFEAECQPGLLRNSEELAVKVHDRERHYRQELDVYRRLLTLGIRRIRKNKVPRLLDFDDDLLVIEMTIVTRPFVLDFGGAYLDQPPDFSEEVLADWRAEKQDQFGADWPEVQAILGHLESLGIFMIDVHPGNISFSC